MWILRKNMPIETLPFSKLSCQKPEQPVRQVLQPCTVNKGLLMRDVRLSRLFPYLSYMSILEGVFDNSACFKTKK